MIASLMLAAAISGNAQDWLALAIERYQAVNTYRVSIRSVHGDEEDRIRYAYRRPGFVRMEFIMPHTGTVLIYSPVTQRARLWPFGTAHFLQLNLNPGNALIRSPRGQRIDHSDIGALFENVHGLQQHGAISAAGEEMLAGHRALHVEVRGNPGFAMEGVHRYELWLDADNLFPRQIVSRDLQGAIIETVYMEDAEINTALPDATFDP